MCFVQCKKIHKSVLHNFKRKAVVIVEEPVVDSVFIVMNLLLKYAITERSVQQLCRFSTETGALAYIIRFIRPPLVPKGCVKTQAAAEDNRVCVITCVSLVLIHSAAKY